MWFQAQYRRCGNKRCGKCPHGPYWYGFFREGGKLRSKYFGKVDPRPKTQSVPPERLDAIFNRSTASFVLACEILGVPTTAMWDEVRLAYRSQAMANHPDRGGCEKTASRLNAAWDYWRSVRPRPAGR